MKAHWQQEKAAISKLRAVKERIEKARFEAEQATNRGDLGRASELQYGTLPGLERELATLNSALADLQKSQRMLKEEVDAEDVAEVVAKWTGIPVSRMLESEALRLLRIEDRLRERVVGQDEALMQVANAVRRSRAGLGDPTRVVGCATTATRLGVRGRRRVRVRRSPRGTGAGFTPAPEPNGPARPRATSATTKAASSPRRSAAGRTR